MSLLSLDVSKCVRTTNKFSTCKACVDACVVNTIEITQQIPSFVPNDCVGCGGCLGACPTSAYTLDDFNVLAYIFSLIEQKKRVLSCKEINVCLATLHVEELIALVLLHPESLTLDRAFCATCEIATCNEPLIEKRVEETNFFLEAVESQKRIAFKNVAASTSS